MSKAAPSLTDLQACLNRLASAKVLVIGDLAIDEMVYGTVDRLSREAPVVILRHAKTDVILGGGANAAHNLASLGVSTQAIGVMGDDYNAPQLLAALKAAHIQTHGVVTDASRPTTTKSRISGTVNQSVTQQVVRIDRESREPLNEQTLHTVLNAIEAQLPGQDAVLLSDYGLGVMQPEVVTLVMQLAKQEGIPVVVDSQGDLTRFAGATLMTPNQPEAEQNLGHALNSPTLWEQGIRQLREACQCQHLLITRGQDGMLLAEASGELTAIPVFNKSEVFDVTGAGDTVVATMTAALATGSSPVQAAILGNLAASLTVRHYGCAVTTVEELREALEQLGSF